MKNKDKCCVRGCGNNRSRRSRLCSKHLHRHYKEINLLAYTYDLLRQNARRRGKIFEITLDEFREFCDETRYLERKGRTAECASIDRIIQSKGYVKGNLQILTVSDNSIKGTDEVCPF